MQFELWRLILSVLSLGIAFGLVRIGWTQAERYGAGILPVLCFFAALVLVSASIGLLFRRARAFVGTLLRFFGEALAMLWP